MESESKKETSTEDRTGEETSEPSPSRPESNDQSGSPDRPKASGQLREILRRQFAMQMETMIPEDVQRILDQLEERLQSLRDSEEVQLADKAVKRIKLTARMIEAWGEGSFSMPWRSITASVGCIFYLINPMNVLPDMLKGDDEEALLDDALVLYLTHTLLEQDLRRFMKQHDINPEDYGFSSRYSAI